MCPAILLAWALGSRSGCCSKCIIRQPPGGSEPQTGYTGRWHWCGTVWSSGGNQEYGLAAFRAFKLMNWCRRWMDWLARRGVR
ncbi:hypothetical protein C8F01DRAFT_1137006 [Mycena amicta]|nr:hypothetical protein C8F01DRAFT_1137006 [Mycena amicta]